MKRLMILLMALIIGFGAFAKSDYKNPIESYKVAELVIQPTKFREVKRELLIAVDGFDNHFISINVNYFYKKGKDDLQIKVKGSEHRLKLDKSIKVKRFSFYPQVPSYTANTSITRVGTHYQATTTVRKEKNDYYEFYSIYPISKELYEEIVEAGVEDIRVDGIYSIIIQ